MGYLYNGYGLLLSSFLFSSSVPLHTVSKPILQIAILSLPSTDSWSIGLY